MTQPYRTEGYIYRDARAEDKPQVLELTAHTWEFGDYISFVFDDWLADPQGRFLVAEEQSSGRLVAIDKLSMLSPTEAWFEGLRVHPDFRGRGLASRLQRYMIGEAARIGARSVRLITLATNTPVHLACYRDGFTLKCIVRFWKWERERQASPIGAASYVPPYTLRLATPGEASILYNWWQRSAAFRTAGLVHRSWSFAQTSAQEWQQAASEQRLMVRDGVPITLDRMPPACVMLRSDTNHDMAPIWVLSAAVALGDEWSPLMRGLVDAALQRPILEINGLQPDMRDAYDGLKSAGFRADPDDDRLALFELSPLPVSG